ncbi:MAG TPA: hypothetical protein VN915_05785 [Elusimicrobiota bacterium]|nr:hypothetical protein [Elusimicrobiota bacterium]
MRFLLAAALLALAAAPCRANGEGDEDDAVPGLQPASGLVLYYDSGAPMSFPSMTPKDVPAGVVKLREVRGRACQRGLAVPIAANFNATNISAYYGNGSYAKAIAQIKKEHPEVIGIYDVRTDVEVFSILGFYKSLCTEVSARAFALAAPPAAPKS